MTWTRSHLARLGRLKRNRLARTQRFVAAQAGDLHLVVVGDDGSERAIDGGPLPTSGTIVRLLEDDLNL